MNYQTPPLKFSYSLRREFFNRFLDKSFHRYRSVMGYGDFYGTSSHKSCLWETFCKYRIISFDSALDFISSRSDLYVTWDNPLSQTARTIQKTRLIKVCGNELASAISDHYCGVSFDNFKFPSDFYVFDESCSFHVTFTHKYIRNFGYICLTSRNDIPDADISCAVRELFITVGVGQFAD